MDKDRLEIIHRLSESLHVEAQFLVDFAAETSFQWEVREDLEAVTSDQLFFIRRIQRLCEAFHTDVPTATLIFRLSERVRHLENELEHLRNPSGPHDDPLDAGQ